jgi:hypothetical protein
MPRCSVELDDAADLGEGNGADQESQTASQDGVVASLPLWVNLKKKLIKLYKNLNHELNDQQKSFITNVKYQMNSNSKKRCLQTSLDTSNRCWRSK